MAKTSFSRRRPVGATNGKGKIVDWLSERAECSSAAFQGGHNAGTAVIDGRSTSCTRLPSVLYRAASFSVIRQTVVVLVPVAHAEEIGNDPRPRRRRSRRTLLIAVKNADDSCPTTAVGRAAKSPRSKGTKSGPPVAGHRAVLLTRHKVGRRAIPALPIGDPATLEARVGPGRCSTTIRCVRVLASKAMTATELVELPQRDRAEILE